MSQLRAGFGWEHLLLAALLLGAGAIHVAMAPPHLAESTVDGAGFVVAGWAQLVLAVAVVVWPTRRLLVGVAGVTAALVALWAWSRTAGLPVGAHAGEPESVSIVDGVSVALEAITLVLVTALLVPVAQLVRLARVKGVALVGAAAAVAFTTAAVASPSAREHTDDGHAHDAGTEQDAGDDHHGEQDDHDDGDGHHADAVTTVPGAGGEHDNSADHHADEVTTAPDAGHEHHDDGHAHD